MITQLRTNNGGIAKNHVDMCKVVQEYFGNLFGVDDNTNEEELDSFEHVLTEEQRYSLEVEFTFEEFSVALKQMHPDKSAAPDCLNSVFYQHFWRMLGKEVFSSCKLWLNDLQFPVYLNNTNIVLILKKENVDSMNELHPIALCNFLYKVIAKVLANCLGAILPEIISEY